MGRIRRRWGEGRDEATALRLQGKSYREIEERLGIPKSTLSNWLSDVPLSEEQRAALEERRNDSARSRAVAIRGSRIRRTEVLQEAAAAEIGELGDRELFLVGVGLYWSEGAKAKPWNTSTRVRFINSDPTMITVFLAWLDLLGVARDQLQLTVNIHERADIAAATRFWADVADVPESSLGQPWLKRHNPKTVRRNTDSDYVGCLVVTVRRSTDLNRRIAGWWSGIASGIGR